MCTLGRHLFAGRNILIRLSGYILEGHNALREQALENVVVPLSSGFCLLIYVCQLRVKTELCTIIQKTI